ncbi:uncharacterized protein G2W53_035700 [Senna tora]|uniref:Uncharacterized protein n=1 Tax=Senna tora TaxID=362788 RepID=A0A834W4A2_9FABA|nr:uncharacterized protein G2W53_035700 [Senna tora]
MKDISRDNRFTVVEKTSLNERKISRLRKYYYIKRNLVL